MCADFENMLHQIIEITKEHKYLNLHRGFMQICTGKNDTFSKNVVPIDDIESLILSAQSTVISQKILIALAKQGAVTVLCDDNHTPSALVLPQGGVMHAGAVGKAQALATDPFNKRIWKEIIKAKISNQAYIISKTTKHKDSILKLKRYAREVQSGDTTAREAVAARLYFKALFGKNFKRDRKDMGINSYLNYGYMVLRASVARNICASGLLAVLGVYHKNSMNNMPLVDDLMEVYRPLIDLAVYRMSQNQKLNELTTDAKKELVKMLYYPVDTERGKSLLINALKQYSTSLAIAYNQKKSTLFYIPKLADEHSYIEEEVW